MAEWITPRTDWTSESYFNIEDYNRIKNNVTYLKDMALKLYLSFSFTDLGTDKTYTDFPYASEFNAIESNLENMKNSTFPFFSEARNTYYDNQQFASAADLNRIETACLKLYSGYLSQTGSKMRLAFTLGNMKGVI